MHTIYDLITGPLLWLSILVFIGGSIYKLVAAWQEARTRDIFVVEYWSWKHVFRSLAHWMVPYRTMRWQTKPVLTAVTFAFHILIFVAPLFLVGHATLIEQWWGISWPALPEWLTDLFTVVVIGCCGYFIWRRLTSPEVRYITDNSDWFVVGVVLATFLSGFLAYHRIGPADTMFVLHVLSGEVFLVMIPFTRANHMLYGLFMRGYMASEFGSVRKCIDW